MTARVVPKTRQKKTNKTKHHRQPPKAFPEFSFFFCFKQQRQQQFQFPASTYLHSTCFSGSFNQFSTKKNEPFFCVFHTVRWTRLPSFFLPSFFFEIFSTRPQCERWFRRFGPAPFSSSVPLSFFFWKSLLPSFFLCGYRVFRCPSRFDRFRWRSIAFYRVFFFPVLEPSLTAISSWTRFFFTEFTEFSFSRRFFFVPLLSFFENGPVAVDLLNFLSKILIKGKHLAEWLEMKIWKKKSSNFCWFHWIIIKDDLWSAVAGTTTVLTLFFCFLFGFFYFQCRMATAAYVLSPEQWKELSLDGVATLPLRRRGNAGRVFYDAHTPSEWLVPIFRF